MLLFSILQHVSIMHIESRRFKILHTQNTFTFKSIHKLDTRAHKEREGAINLKIY